MSGAVRKGNGCASVPWQQGTEVNKVNNLRFQVLIAAYMKTTVLWVVAPRSVALGTDVSEVLFCVHHEKVLLIVNTSVAVILITVIEDNRNLKLPLFLNTET